VESFSKVKPIAFLRNHPNFCCSSQKNAISTLKFQFFFEKYKIYVGFIITEKIESWILSYFERIFF